MLKKLLPLLALLLVLTGCGQKKEVFQTVYLDAFDTVTTLRGYAVSAEEFNEIAENLHQELLEYHELFDVYNDYPGVVNLKAVNDAAGSAPVKVDSRIPELLNDCREYYTLTGGRVNVAMGSVLCLWHEARTDGLADPDNARLPDADALRLAAEHTSFDNVVIDAENSTVFLTDPQQRLDVGAVAKGWTAQKLSRKLPEGYMLNMGGNICAVGGKPGGDKWNVGIQSPDSAAEYLRVVQLKDCSAVTSGDYQRSYRVDGKEYHHIIDPDTLMPSEYWRSVSILCRDSGLADCLSTALFLLPLDEGRALAEKCNVDVMWYLDAEHTYSTPGFDAATRKS